MNLDLNEGKELLCNLLDKHVHTNVISIIAPPFIHLNTFKTMLSHTNIALAAQNCHQQDEGAFTGEVSVKMLKSVGVQYVILGHSERREYFQEDSLAIHGGQCCAKFHASHTRPTKLHHTHSGVTH